MNIVAIKGNLTRAPEMRASPSGMQITSFAIAVNRVYATKDGENRSKVVIILENFDFINGNKSDAQTSQDAPPPAQEPDEDVSF